MLPGGVCETQRVCGVAVFLVAHLLLFFNSYLNFLLGGSGSKNSTCLW